MRGLNLSDYVERIDVNGEQPLMWVSGFQNPEMAICSYFDGIVRQTEIAIKDLRKRDDGPESGGPAY